jgi:hypothetical protein
MTADAPRSRREETRAAIVGIDKVDLQGWDGKVGGERCEQVLN